MDIILSTDPVDLQECDILVAGFFHDERPLKGSSGWIDWRLNGLLSRFLIEKKLTGEWKETTLIPSYGRLTPPMILLVGLGKLADYSYLRLREFSFPLFDALKNLKKSSVCISLPSEERYNVNYGKSTEVLIEGIADRFDVDQSSSYAEWVGGLRLFFSIEEATFPEILLGVQTAQSILKDRLKINMIAPHVLPGSLIP